MSTPRWRVRQPALTRSGLTLYNMGLPLLLLTLLSLALPDFRQLQNAQNFTGQLATPLLAALGQLFVALVAGIDLSVGSVVSLAGCIIATQPDALSGICLALLMGGLVGLINGCGVAYARVHPLVMTLSTATFLQGLAYLILPIPGGQIAAPLVQLANGNMLGLPYAVLWCAAAVLAVATLLYHSRIGLHLFATGGNPHSAYLNGVSVARMVVLAYVLCSLMAVVAGIYLTARVSAADPTMGASIALESVAAVALGGISLTGGIGSVSGVVLGAVSLGLMANGLNLFGVSPFFQGVLTGLLLLTAVSLQRRRHIGL